MYVLYPKKNEIVLCIPLTLNLTGFYWMKWVYCVAIWFSKSACNRVSKLIQTFIQILVGDSSDCCCHCSIKLWWIRAENSKDFNLYNSPEEKARWGKLIDFSIQFVRQYVSIHNFGNFSSKAEQRASLIWGGAPLRHKTAFCRNYWALDRP